MYQARTVGEILKDLRSSVKSEVAGTDPWIWPNNLVPLLKALAQAMRAGDLRLQFIHEQAFVTTSQGEYLDYHGIQTGGLSRGPAQFAQGLVTVEATLGSTIDDGTKLMRADGVLYSVVGTTTVTQTPMDIFARAEEPGEFGNVDGGAELLPVSPVLGVTSWIVSDDGLIGGTESETDDSFRQRILYVKQNPPHGGSPSEYVEWAQTKTGVTRVFIKRATPVPGSVTIYFMMDSVGNGVPSASDVDDLQNILDQLAPSDADVQVIAPIPQAINITINSLVPDTADIRDRVVDELKAMFIREAEPASVTTPFVFSKGWISEALSYVPKLRRGRVTVPADDVTISTAGVIPILGTITFT